MFLLKSILLELVANPEYKKVGLGFQVLRDIAESFIVMISYDNEHL